MDEYDAYWLWVDFNHIASSSVSRLRDYVDQDDPYIDWDRQEQAMLIASLSFACSLFEVLGVSKCRPHNHILWHLRNAVLHNGGDITKNFHSPIPHDECIDYLKDELWNEFNPPQSIVHSQYFEISLSGIVTLKGSLYFFIERLFDSHMGNDQRSRPGPKLKS